MSTPTPPLSHSQRDNLQSAGLGRRLGAMVYDSLLLIALYMTTTFFLVAATNGQVAGKSWYQMLLALETYGFFAFFWLRNRQTLGMLAWGLEVQPLAVAGPDGDPLIPRLTPTQVTKRFIGACLSIASAGLGYLWILLDPQKRSWADWLSGTRIVYIPR